jgi:two-component system OmpR family response regulator
MRQELKKILFVDDDEDIHFIVKLCLRDIPGVEFRSAFSGEEALKIAMDFKPDLILLDVMMPKMDGIATLKAIKLLPTLAMTPVVFLTAKVQKNEVEEYLKSGILDVIVKPFDPSTLAQLLQQIWNKHLN